MHKKLELGASFIVLGGNPESRTSIRDVIATTKEAKDILGDKMLILLENRKMELLKRS